MRCRCVATVPPGFAPVPWRSSQVRPGVVGSGRWRSGDACPHPRDRTWCEPTVDPRSRRPCRRRARAGRGEGIARWRSTSGIRTNGRSSSPVRWCGGSIRRASASSSPRSRRVSAGVNVFLGTGPKDGRSALGSAAAWTIPLGERLHVALVRVGDLPLVPGVLYGYDVTLVEPDGAQHDLTSEGLLGGDVPLGYVENHLPGFVLPLERDHLRIVHASCRKPHGEGVNMLPTVEHADRRRSPRPAPPAPPSAAALPHGRPDLRRRRRPRIAAGAHRGGDRPARLGRETAQRKRPADLVELGPRGRPRRAVEVPRRPRGAGEDGLLRQPPALLRRVVRDVPHGVVERAVAALVGAVAHVRAGRRPGAGARLQPGDPTGGPVRRGARVRPARPGQRRRPTCCSTTTRSPTTGT